MSEKILMVMEGKKSEAILFNNIKKNFVNFSDVDFSFECVYLPIGQTIYSLAREIEKDENLETTLLLIGISKKLTNEPFIHPIDSFSRIYLFFDFDPQHIGSNDELASLDDIDTMLQIFSNETEHGKLYISYPMLEAIRHTNIEKDCINCCVVTFDDCRKQGTKSKYKQIVANYSDCTNQNKYNHDM
jgi:hypothetical protein